MLLWEKKEKKEAKCEFSSIFGQISKERGEPADTEAAVVKCEAEIVLEINGHKKKSGTIHPKLFGGP